MGVAVILACHLVWTAYGWWFPNDPRGSWSKEVWVPELQGLENGERAVNGAAKRGRRAIQPSSARLRQWLGVAQRRLKHRPVILNSEAREVAKNAIVEHTRLHQYEVLALALKPDHVHVVVRRHEHKYQRIVRAFKGVSSRELRKYLGLAASPDRAKRAPVWSRGYWVRYLDTDKAIASATAYVRRQAKEDNT